MYYVYSILCLLKKNILIIESSQIVTTSTSVSTSTKVLIKRGKHAAFHSRSNVELSALYRKKINRKILIVLRNFHFIPLLFLVLLVIALP